MIRLLVPIVEALLGGASSHHPQRRSITFARAVLCLCVVAGGWWYLHEIDGQVASMSGRVERIENALIMRGVIANAVRVTPSPTPAAMRLGPVYAGRG